MTEDHDPYAVLGVTPVATPAEINHAFRVKVRVLHPDTRHPRASGAAGDTQLEKLIAAYHLLHDPESRALHDRNAIAATVPRRQPPSPSPSRSVFASPDGPLTIPVTHHRHQSPAAACLIWVGPVRRHRMTR
jgi:curved DNA-binding protein CbpA